MDQETNEPRRRAGGDHRTPIAKQQIAQREQQIVALRLRHHSFAAIGRVVGVTRANAQKAYLRALHRNTDQDIQTHHRSELAELEMEAAAAWELVDAKDSPKSRAQGLAALNRITSVVHGYSGWTRPRSSTSARSMPAASTNCPRNGWRGKPSSKPCRWTSRNASMTCSRLRVSGPPARLSKRPPLR
jgi:hypothetical protein